MDNEVGFDLIFLAVFEIIYTTHLVPMHNFLHLSILIFSRKSLILQSKKFNEKDVQRIVSLQRLRISIKRTLKSILIWRCQI